MKNFVRFVLRCVFRMMKIRVSFQTEPDSFPTKGIYISNHTSWLDPVVLFAFLPHNPVILLHPKLYRNEWIRFFLTYADIMEYNYMDAADAKKVIELVKKDRYCLMFPEGCMTDTGDIMKIYEAPAIVAERTGAPLIPIWINGTQYSPFSETGFYQPHRLFPKTKIKVGAPYDYQMDKDLKKSRDYLRDITYHLLNQMRFEANYKSNLTLFHQLIRTSRIYGKKGILNRPYVVEDVDRRPHTYRDIMLKSYILGRKFVKLTSETERVGLMLPNSIGNVVSLFALSAFRRVPVMLNFSQGPSTILSMCRTATLKQVITSRTFVEKGKLEETIAELEANGLKIVYLEDVKKSISFANKLRGVWDYRVKRVPVKQASTEDAVILFTSGSEGFPKAVVLSHANIIANINQVACFAKVTPRDLLFNFLPMFHSFGLVVGTLFPLLQGCRLFLFPTPLLYRSITELLYEVKATVIIGTDTFFRVYTKISHPYDFRSIRICYAGAESIKADTRAQMAERLGCQLLEAYGSTECAPVVCLNNILFNKYGSLGKVVPAMEYKLEPVEGITNGEELCVRGPNVMKGYMMPENPGVLVPPKDGWYHTGDIVTVDELGFVKIVDRVKRFAKIGGEMVSLMAVENVARDIWTDKNFRCGTVAIPHPKKGEQIIFVSNDKSANKDTFAETVQKKGLSELYVPSLFLYKEEIPFFATGKPDNVSLKKWVLNEIKND